MTDKSIWFVTGAGRGMGVDIAKAALAAGHAVVATGRRSEAVTRALGRSEHLLGLNLDVTRPEDATAAVAVATERFGHIDVLVNNAPGVDSLAPTGFSAAVHEPPFLWHVRLTSTFVPSGRDQLRSWVHQLCALAPGPPRTLGRFGVIDAPR